MTWAPRKTYYAFVRRDAGGYATTWRARVKDDKGVVKEGHVADCAACETSRSTARRRRPGSSPIGEGTRAVAAPIRKHMNHSH